MTRFCILRLAELEPDAYGGGHTPVFELQAFSSWRIEVHTFHHRYSPKAEARRHTFRFVALLAGFGVLDIV